MPLVPIPAPDGDEGDGYDPRITPPFELNPMWKADRQKARIYELIVGFSGYMTGTWEGWFCMMATVAGVAGGYFVLKAVLDF